MNLNHRLTVCLTEKQEGYLNQEAERIGISKGSIVRLLIDERMKEGEK